MMVAAERVRHGEVISRHWGLNDAIIARIDARNLVRLCTSINGEEIATYIADGLIISTPTGSTAYTLSAGGPIVSPTVESLTITPICPHTLNSRPLVVDAAAVIKVRAEDRGRSRLGMALTMDGQETADLGPEDEVVLRRADFCAKLVRISGPGFYERLRTKLQWGGER